LQEAEGLRARLKHVEAEASKEIRSVAEEMRDHLHQLEAAAAASSKELQTSKAVAEASALETEALRQQLEQLQTSKATAEESALEMEALRQHLEQLQTAKAAAEASAVETEALRKQLREAEASSQEAAQDVERGRTLCSSLETSLNASEAASEALKHQLTHWESTAHSLESRCAELRLRHVEIDAGKGDEPCDMENVRLRHVEASSKQLEQLSSDLRQQLRKVEESTNEQEARAEDFGIKLREIQEAAADKEKRNVELWTRLRHVDGLAQAPDSASEAFEKLREVVSEAKESPREGFQVRLRHVEASATETQAASQRLQYQLKHIEASSASLEDEVQHLRVKLRHVTQPETEDTGVQTDSGAKPLAPRRTRKTVLFGVTEQQPLPGSVPDAQPSEQESEPEKPERRPRSKSRIKSVDFSRQGSAVSFELESEEENLSEENLSDEPMTGCLSMASQVSEYYDTYNETSQPARRRSRARSTLETYNEEDLWNPEHVAMVTCKLFLKHDTDGTGRIEWASGEAIKFLHEFFWLHKQPPPKIPKPAFHALYSQVKSDSKFPDESQEDAERRGLNVEEMTKFAIKVNEFVYKQLGKEMRAQRKSFAISTGDAETLRRMSQQEAAQDPGRRPTQRRATLGGAKLQDVSSADATPEEQESRRFTQRRATLAGSKLQDLAAARESGAEVGFQRLAQRRATRVGVDLKEMMAAEASLKHDEGDDEE